MRASINAAQWVEVDRIPKPDALIRGTSASSEQASVQGRPVDGFNGCLMLRELGERLRTLRRPNEQLVVVTARG